MLNSLKNFYSDWNKRGKDVVPDLGEFLISLFVCNDRVLNYYNPMMKKAILEEFLTR